MSRIKWGRRTSQNPSLYGATSNAMNYFCNLPNFKSENKESFICPTGLSNLIPLALCVSVDPEFAPALPTTID
jgi:hypothetical protein